VDNKLGQVDIIGVDVESGEPGEVIVTPDLETQPAIDPSGKWLAFVRRHEGDFHVYVTTLEVGGPLVHVSVQPGRSSHWAADGKSIYYLRWERVNSGGRTSSWVGPPRRGAPPERLPARAGGWLRIGPLGVLAIRSAKVAQPFQHGHSS